MDYAEALKKVQSNKTKENFMLINISYSKDLILPYKDGIQLMASLTNAEQLLTPYQQQHRIAGLERDAVTSRVFSHEEYEQYKIAALLNVTIDEVKEYANKQHQPTDPP